MILDAIGIAEQHPVQALTDQVLQILQDEVLFLCMGKLPAQQIEVDFADIKLTGRCDPLSRLLNLDILTDDAVDFHHQIHIVCRPAFSIQQSVDGGNSLIFLPGIRLHILPVHILHQARQLGGIGLKGLLFLQGGGHCVGRRLQKSQLFKASGVNQRLQRKIPLC